jgi:hypothetical protein
LAETEVCESTVAEIASRLLGKRADFCESIVGGRNSKVFKVSCGNSHSYVVKLYAAFKMGQRDRLRTEFSALQFMWGRGMRTIPQAVAVDFNARCLIYNFIDAEPVQPQKVGKSDICEAVDFLNSLRLLSVVSESKMLPAASEAFYSIQAVFGHIEERLYRLLAIELEGDPYTQLRGFLKDEFSPVLLQTRTWCNEECEKRGERYDREVWRGKWMLSPSDFGFHNALRDQNEKLVFLDFEHFGWDDPAKLIADFLLHPHKTMNLDQPLREYFFSLMVKRFADSALQARVQLALPVFALKWCMILLNEFIPEDLSRREFAQASLSAREDLQRTQLDKARRMLEQCRILRNKFPVKESYG